MITCSLCHKEKPDSEFWADKNKLSGHQSECKECKRMRNRIYNRKPERLAFTKECVRKLRESGYYKEYSRKHKQVKPETKQTYTLNCQKCGEVFYSAESFPDPQLCPECAKGNAKW